MDSRKLAIHHRPTGQRTAVTFGRLRLLGRSPRVILFLLFICAFAYTPPRWQDWNQNSRFDLTRAIVDQRTVRIDDYAHNTGDYAEIDGRIYSDKAPGVSLMAVPVYAVTQAFQPYGLSSLSDRVGSSQSFTATLNPEGQGSSSERIDVAVSLYIATLIVVAIPAALALVLLALIVERLSGCRTAGILTALVIGLATPVFPYAQAFYGHVPAAACVIAALALVVLRRTEQLSAGRLVGIGALLGWATVIEFPALIVGLPVALWAVWLARSRAVIYGVLGSLPPLAMLVIYDLIAFGTVMPVGYQHSALWQEQHSVGFLSLTYPRWDAISGLLWSSFRGMFFFAPVLLLALPGLVLAFRDRRQRPGALVALASFGLFFIFISSSIMWWGGFAVGPRYLVPAIPMLAIPLGATIAWLNSREFAVRAAGLGASGLLALISAVVVWSTTFAGQNYPTDALRNPLIDYVIPALRDGNIARNLGMALRLDGMLSVLPLLIILGLGLLRILAMLATPREVAP